MPEGEAGALPNVAVVDGGPRVNARLGKTLRESGAHPDDRGRDRRRHEQAQASALVAIEIGQLGRELGIEIGPRGGNTALARGRRALRIVELEYRRLGDEVGAAEATGVGVVSLDLGRATFVRLDEKPERIPPSRDRGGVVGRNAGNDVFRHLRVRNDLLDGPPAALGTHERKSGRHRPKKAAAAEDHRLFAGRRVDVTLGKFGRSLLAEERRVVLSRALLQAAPVLRGPGPGLVQRRGRSLAHRWHPQQFSGGSSFRGGFDVTFVLPGHVRNLCNGSNVLAVALLLAHVAVALEAPPHAEGLHQAHLVHLVDATVALGTADPTGHVHAMVEIDVVGQLVDADRTGRNPQTGQTIKIKASTAVKFRAGAEFKKSVNK